MQQKFLEPSQTAGRDFVMRKIEGPVVMLNLLRFRAIADYTGFPHLVPANPISGQEAYDVYIRHTLPFLKASGGEILFMGKGGKYLIGPSEAHWDAVLLIRQRDVSSFLAFQQNEEYMKGIGHRIAALEDSRLLPIEEMNFQPG